MRLLRSVLIPIALLMGTASTSALSLKKRIEAPGLPSKIRDVNQIVAPCGRGSLEKKGMRSLEI